MVGAGCGLLGVGLGLGYGLACSGSALMSRVRTASFHAALCSPAAADDQRPCSPPSCPSSSASGSAGGVALDGCCIVPSGSLDACAARSAPGGWSVEWSVGYSAADVAGAAARASASASRGW